MNKIANDLQASQLHARLLSGDLTAEERKALERYQADSAEAASYSRWSTLIQESIVEHASADASLGGDDEAGTGLSAIARERLKHSLHRASVEAMRVRPSSSLQVAEQDTVYYMGNNQVDAETRQALCRFTLLHKIGQGGLGTVWLARDEKLRRNVAVKEMNPSALESPRLLQRFQREAEITGHLEHPNVVPLYLSGINSDTGLPFYAMRFLGKQTLADAIREYHLRRAAGDDDPIQFHRLLTTFLDICQAIAYAHSRGVIHRDLKPENVALDSFGQVLVLDWGLAKLESDGELSTRLALSGSGDSDRGGPDSNSGSGNSGSPWSQTVHGDVIGTPLYMAPEQAGGDLSRVDSRTDVYGLGGILFAILAGVAPHQNSSKSSEGTLSAREFLQSIAESESPNARDINPSIPIELNVICSRAIAREKFARQSSATELAAEVERWIAGIHEKKARYESMRMAGRDLKSRLCVQIRQLAATAQFMVELPPIQGLVSSTLRPSAEDRLATWRDRLAKILVALAKSKPNVTSLNFSQIIDGRATELVRIERSRNDLANVRSIPQSQLRSRSANEFHQSVLHKFPGESSFVVDRSAPQDVRLISGVPVFDVETEEPFGLVCAEAEIGTLVLPELQHVSAQDSACLLDENNHLLLTTDAKCARTTGPSQTHPRWPEISRALAESNEFTDPDHEYYATRLGFPQSGLAFQFLFRISS